jgi:hypothetical protein
MGIDGAEFEPAGVVEQEEDDNADLGLGEQELEWDDMVEDEGDGPEIEELDEMDPSFMLNQYYQGVINNQTEGPRLRPRRGLKAPERLTYF